MAAPAAVSLPRTLFQTTHLPFAAVPSGLLTNVSHVVEHRLYSDRAAHRYLERQYGSHMALAFSRLEGANRDNRADLWRYAVLQRHGGIYLDVKTRGVRGVGLHQVFPVGEPHSKPTLYTVVRCEARRGCHVHNGVLAATAGGHGLLERLMELTIDAVSRAALRASAPARGTSRRPASTLVSYAWLLRAFYTELTTMTGRNISGAGTFESLDGTSRVVLFEERCRTWGFGRSAICRLALSPDRYGLCCAIYRSPDAPDHQPLLLTRDAYYPAQWCRALNVRRANGTLPGGFWNTSTKCPSPAEGSPERRGDVVDGASLFASDVRTLLRRRGPPGAALQARLQKQLGSDEPRLKLLAPLAPPSRPTLRCAVRLRRQTSRRAESACVLGYSFGCVDERAVWVDHGCRGFFVVGVQHDQVQQGQQIMMMNASVPAGRAIFCGRPNGPKRQLCRQGRIAIGNRL